MVKRSGFHIIVNSLIDEAINGFLTVTHEAKVGPFSVAEPPGCLSDGPGATDIDDNVPKNYDANPSEAGQASDTDLREPGLEVRLVDCS